MSSNLREQFIDYMTLQGFSECTQKGYVSAVKGLPKFYNLSPDGLLLPISTITWCKGKWVKP